MKRAQASLFDSRPSLPPGFEYRPEFISEGEERELLEHFAGLPFKAFEFHGYEGNRRVVSFGWHYDFNTMELRKAEDIPAFLLPVQERAAAFAGLLPPDLEHVLLTEYAAGAGIGWHRDRSVFDEVVGVSLAAPCTFRLRRKTGPRQWERASLVAERRSAYLLSGAARTEWEHSIPPVDALRYSITFRNIRTK